MVSENNLIEKKDFSLSFHHMALSVNDVNISAKFYTEVLNLEIIPLLPEAKDVNGFHWEMERNYICYPSRVPGAKKEQLI